MINTDCDSVIISFLPIRTRRLLGSGELGAFSLASVINKYDGDRERLIKFATERGFPSNRHPTIKRAIVIYDLARGTKYLIYEDRTAIEVLIYPLLKRGGISLEALCDDLDRIASDVSVSMRIIRDHVPSIRVDFEGVPKSLFQSAVDKHDLNNT